MKLRLLLLSLLGGLFFANAQYTVRDGDGNIINDGDIIEFGSLEYPAAELLFYVTNDNPNETIYSRVQYMSQINAQDPKFEQLCYGVECYFNIELLSYVPPVNMEAVDILPEHTTGIGNHFYSNDPGNGVDNVDFVFAFRQYAGLNDMTETGTPLFFTYRYNPLLSVNDVKPVNLSLNSTVVSERLVLDVNEPVQLAIYDLQGKLIRQMKLETGNREVNVADLSSQMYILQFKNDHGALKTSKIVVK